MGMDEAQKIIPDLALPGNSFFSPKFKDASSDQKNNSNERSTMSGTSKPGRIPGKARKPVVFSKPPVIITDDDDDNKPSDVSGLRRNIDNRRSGSMKQFFQKDYHIVSRCSPVSCSPSSPSINNNVSSPPMVFTNPEDDDTMKTDNCDVITIASSSAESLHKHQTTTHTTLPKDKTDATGDFHYSDSEDENLVLPEKDEEMECDVFLSDDDNKESVLLNGDKDEIYFKNAERLVSVQEYAENGKFGTLLDLDRVSDKDTVYFNTSDLRTRRNDGPPSPIPPVPEDSKLKYGLHNYVSLPWSTNNVKKKFRSFIAIQYGLEQIADGLTCIDGLCAAMRIFASVTDFTAIHKYWDTLEDDEQRLNLLETISKMAKLALRGKDLITQPLRCLAQLTSKCSVSATLSQEQCACLLSHAFFCTFDQPLAHYNSFSMKRIFSAKNPLAVCKLKFIFTYFEKVTTSMPSGCVSFIRCRNKAFDYDKCDLKVTELSVTSEKIEDCSNCLQVDFANKFIGGGVLGHGSVQEEIRFLCSPEMMVSMLICPKMNDNEAIFIVGAQTFSSYDGYSHTLEWKPFERFGQEPRDKFQRVKVELVAIDAIEFSSSFRARQQQYSSNSISRELDKAYNGFCFPFSSQFSRRPVATGNWGCGAFGGDLQLKFVIQLMAATVSGRKVLYCPFGEEKFSSDCLSFYQAMVDRKITIRQLYNMLVDYPNNRTIRVFSYIMKKTNHEIVLD